MSLRLQTMRRRRHPGNRHLAMAERQEKIDERDHVDGDTTPVEEIRENEEQKEAEAKSGETQNASAETEQNGEEKSSLLDLKNRSLNLALMPFGFAVIADAD